LLAFTGVGVVVVVAFDILLFLELVLLEPGSLTGVPPFFVNVGDSFLELDLLKLLLLEPAGALLGVPIFGIVDDSFLDLNLRFLGLKVGRSLCSLSDVRFSELRIAESHSLTLSRTTRVSE
jgi:hypothetical protein